MQVKSIFKVQLIFVSLLMNSSMSISAMECNTHRDVLASIKLFNELQGKITGDCSPVERERCIQDMAAILDGIQQYQETARQELLPVQQTLFLKRLGFAPVGEGQIPYRRMMLQALQLPVYTPVVRVTAIKTEEPVQRDESIRTQDAQEACVHEPEKVQLVREEIYEDNPTAIFPSGSINRHLALEMLEEGARSMQPEERFAARPLIVQYDVLSQAGNMAAAGSMPEEASEEEFAAWVARGNDARYFGNTCGRHAIKNALCMLSMLHDYNRLSAAANKVDDTACIQFNHRVFDLRELTDNTRRMLEIITEAQRGVAGNDQRMSVEEIASVVERVTAQCIHGIHECDIAGIRPEQLVVVPEVAMLEVEAAFGQDAMPLSFVAQRAIEGFVSSQDDCRAFLVLLQETGDHAAMSHWITVIAYKRAGVPFFIVMDSNSEHANPVVMQRIVGWGLIGRLLGEPVARIDREEREAREREEAARLEQERLVREEAARQEAERIAREEREAREREEAARLEQERLDREEAERLQREEQEGAARRQAERLEQERLDREEAERLQREEEAAAQRHAEQLEQAIFVERLHRENEGGAPGLMLESQQQAEFQAVVARAVRECQLCNNERSVNNFVTLSCHETHDFCLDCLNREINRSRENEIELRCPIDRGNISAQDQRVIQERLARGPAAMREDDEQAARAERARLAAQQHAAAAVPQAAQAARVDSQPAQIECAICLDDKPLGDFVYLNCGHRACRECLETPLEMAVRERNAQLLRCPGCNARINSDEEILDIAQHARINIDGEILENRQILNRMRDIQIETEFIGPEQGREGTNLRRCQTPNCGIAFYNDPEHPQTYRCQGCNQRYCSHCLHDHPMDRTCQQAADEAGAQARGEHDAWLAENIRACPNCHKRIWRDGGCQHMTCRRLQGGCGHEFCWVCLDPWNVPGRICQISQCRTQDRPQNWH